MNGLPILSQCHIPATLWAHQEAPKQSSLLEKFPPFLPTDCDQMTLLRNSHCLLTSSGLSLQKLQTLIPYLLITNSYNRFTNAKLSTPRFHLIEITRLPTTGAWRVMSAACDLGISTSYFRSRDSGIGCDSNQQISSLLLPSIFHFSSYFLRPRLLCRQLRNLRVDWYGFPLALYSASTDAIQHLQLPVSLNKTFQSLAFIVTLLFAFHIIIKMYTDVVSQLPKFMAASINAVKVLKK